ncbi:MAG TPA: NHLP bacteriocin system secretion protein [Allocoleopsis sp.]
MQGQGRSSLFRKESLERLSSPEQLDQLMQVVSPKAWLPLTALGTLVGIAVMWSVLGRIPITVAGQGVLIRPGKVLQFQSPLSGQLKTLNVKAGDTLKKGDIIGTLDQGGLRNQLQNERAKLADLLAQDRAANTLQGQQSEREKTSLTSQRQSLEQSLRDAQNLTPVLKDKSLEALASERRTLQGRVQALQAIVPTMKEQWERRQQLAKDGALSTEVVLQAQQEYFNNVATLSEAQSQLKQLDVRETDAKREYLANLNTITDIRAKLRDLDSQETSIARKNLEDSTNRQNQIQEVKRNIAQLELQLQGNSKIVSPYSGRILEIAAVPGQVISPGVNLGTLSVENPSDKLVSLTYFTVEDGKKIKPGMPVQVTPNTVKRERFGGILGSVTSVAPFAATPEGAKVIVGNDDMVKTIMSGGRQIEVFAQLQEDPLTYSAYKWSSSKGPQLKISPGTTTQVRVKVGERAPISYVIPLLKSFTGT